jgi:hypothetical protein
MNSSPDRIHPSAVSDGCELEKDVVFNWLSAAAVSVLALPLLVVALPVCWIVRRVRRRS